jgi:hypothetical protein
MKRKLAKFFHRLSVKLGYEIKIINCKLDVKIEGTDRIGVTKTLEKGFITDFTSDMENSLWKRFNFTFYGRLDEVEKFEAKCYELNSEVYNNPLILTQKKDPTYYDERES